MDAPAARSRARLVPYCVSVALALGLFLLSLVSYERASPYLATTAEGFLETGILFTPDVYRRWVLALAIAGITLWFLTALAWIFRGQLRAIRRDYLRLALTDVKSLHRDLRTALRTLLREEKPALAALCLVTALGGLLRFHFLSHDVQVDEASSFLLYSRMPTFGAISQYAANNHILNSLLMKFSAALFGMGPEVIRLPAFIFGVTLIPASFAMGYAFFRQARVALSGAALVAAAPYLIEYSVNGRGYTLQACLLAAAWCLALHFRRTSNLVSALALGVVSALGFITIPTMAFGYAAVATWLVLEAVAGKLSRGARKAYFTHLGASVAVLGALVLAGYLPAIIFVGPDEILRNPFVLPQPMGVFVREFPAFVRDVFSSWNWGGVPALRFVLGPAALVAVAAHRRLAVASRVSPAVSFFVGCGLLLLLNHRIPFTRAFVIFIPLYLLLAAAGCCHLADRLVSRARWRGALAACAACGLMLPVGLGLKFVRDNPRGALKTEFRETYFSDRVRNAAAFLIPRLGAKETVVYMGHPFIILSFYFQYLNAPDGHVSKTLVPSAERLSVLLDRAPYEPQLNEIRSVLPAFSPPELVMESAGLRLYLFTRRI